MNPDRHPFFLEIDEGAVFLHIECPYEPADEVRPCWPHLEDGSPEPPSEHAWEQCTYRDWNDNLTMVEWVHGNATVELPNAWVDWSNGDYPIVRLTAMTDIPQGQGGDGSPQLDLDAIERQARIQQNIRAHLRDCDAENDALRGRVEELTALIERMLKIHGEDYDALVAADWETADGLHELAEEAWVTDARAALAKVVPEKKTP